MAVCGNLRHQLFPLDFKHSCYREVVLTVSKSVSDILARWEQDQFAVLRRRQLFEKVLTRYDFPA